MASFSFYTKAFAFADPNQTNNPQLRNFDWTRQINGLPVNSPGCREYRVDPFDSLDIFNGTKAITVDNTTVFSVSNVSGYNSKYRLAYVSGTVPGFRTARSLTLSGGSATFTPQANQSVVLTHSGGSVFGSVQTGDIVYVPGVSTGDTALFDPLNEGEWSVLYAAASALTLVRLPGSIYEVKGETVALTTNTQIQAFSAAGVQIDDVLQLKASFPTTLTRSYEITRVTANSLEFVSTQILPAITSITPGIGSVVIYSDAKQFLGIESNQEIELFINGSTTGIPIEPWVAGDPTKVGSFHSTGTAFSLSITNKTAQQATVTIWSVE